VPRRPREQIAERRGVKDALIRRFYLPRAYNAVLRDLQELFDRARLCELFAAAMR